MVLKEVIDLIGPGILEQAWLRGALNGTSDGREVLMVPLQLGFLAAGKFPR